MVTPESVIAACALGFSIFAFWRGEETKRLEEEIRRHLYQIELARYQREQAAQAGADFYIGATKEPVPYGVAWPQQPYGVHEPLPQQYQYIFSIHNVGRSQARDLFVEVRTVDDSVLSGSYWTDLLPPTYSISSSFTLDDFSELKLAVRWKDRANPEGNLIVFPPLVFLPSPPTSWPPPSMSPSPPYWPADGADLAD